MGERPPRPVLLVGSGGMLGRSLAGALTAAGERVHAPTRRQLDLENPESVQATVESARPAAAINAAAFSDVDEAERPENRDRVYRINRDGPEALARACARRGIPVVHVSTDYVFDGVQRRPYEEDDRPRPLQVYGATKLEGERAVLAASPAALVVRTSTLYGPGPRARPHYVDAILRQSASRAVVEVVEAPVSSPTYTEDLAGAILALLSAGAGGVVHAVNAGACSRLELARAVVELAGRADRVEVRPRPEPEGSLRRPAYSALATRRLEALTGAALRPWRAALAEYVRSATAGG